MADWNPMTAYGGEYTEEAHRALAELLARDDLPDLRGTTTRLTECPCARYGEGHGCDVDKLPDHATCGPGVEGATGMCWTWTGCRDPECDHPACGGKGWRDFGRWWKETFGEESFKLGEGVLLWTTPWETWLEASPRHPVLLDEYIAAGKTQDPAKLLRVLERGPCYPVKVGMDYLDMEIELARRGIPMEERMVAETNLSSLAYRICHGNPTLPTGGTMTNELRLAQALDLEAAPEGYQGALFA